MSAKVQIKDQLKVSQICVGENTKRQLYVVVFLSVAQLVTTVIIFSAWDKSQMLNVTTPKIQYRKWGPKPLLDRSWIILYYVEFCGLFSFWFVGYLFLVIISSFEAIFCSISRHYSSKKVVILHFRKASKRVMLMSSFHVLHDWTPCGN